jgi:cell filamentation protein
VKPSSDDPYCYPGTEILRNLKGIQDAEELAVFEAASVAIRLVRLLEESLAGPFGLQRLLTTHRRIFDGVYPWAGELRQNTGMIKKQRTADRGVVYADSAFIQPAIERLFQSLQKENFLSGLPPQQFALRAAYFYGEIDAIHPFREGNSRTLRQFFTDLALAAGYKIDWTAISSTVEGRDQLYFARDLAVMRGDSSQLARIFADNLLSIQPRD